MLSGGLGGLKSAIYNEVLQFVLIWLGALCIKLFGWLLGDVMAARVSTIGIFVTGALSVWYTAFHLGRRADAQPLRLAFGGQPEPNDYGRTLADTALLIYLGCLGLLLHSHETLAVTLQGSLLAYFLYRAVRYVEAPSVGNAGLIGLALGGLTLTRGWLSPCTLALALFLAILGRWTTNAKLPAVMLGNLLAGFAMFALSWRLVLAATLSAVARATAGTATSTPVSANRPQWMASPAAWQRCAHSRVATLAHGVTSGPTPTPTNAPVLSVEAPALPVSDHRALVIEL